VQPNHTDDETVDPRNNKTAPHLSADEDRRNDGEKTGKVVQPEHRQGAPLIFTVGILLVSFVTAKSRECRFLGKQFAARYV
jgi:hypothetical protein